MSVRLHRSPPVRTLLYVLRTGSAYFLFFPRAARKGGFQPQHVRKADARDKGPADHRLGHINDPWPSTPPLFGPLCVMLPLFLLSLSRRLPLFCIFFSPCYILGWLVWLPALPTPMGRHGRAQQQQQQRQWWESKHPEADTPRTTGIHGDGQRNQPPQPLFSSRLLVPVACPSHRGGARTV